MADGPKDINDLVGRMSTQDNEQVEPGGLSVDEVILAATDPSTRNGYHLAQRRLLIHLYRKDPITQARLLHADVIAGFSSIPQGKEYEKLLSERAKKFCKDASPSFHPLNFVNFTEQDFIDFLLSLTDTKNSKFRKSYGDLRSALTYLYSRCEVVQSAEFKLRLQTAMKGLKNTAAKARGKTGAALGTGKHPLPFQVYRQICTWLLEDESDESIFAHCFLTVTWNLICRSKNTVKIHRNHIGWNDDCMTVLFAHSKTDTAGDTAYRERHLYANPLAPEICCVTSMARYLSCSPLGWDGLLFPGSDQYDRFRKILQRIVALHADELSRLGIDPENIGVHSIRKGAATYVCNGTTGTVSFSAVCLRAGWTMGNVKDRYIHHEDAGDHVVGRVVAGLDVLSSQYLVSPPIFAVSRKNHCSETLVDEVIRSVWGTASKAKWKLLRYMLASLCFHLDFHENVIHKKSRFRSTIAFRRTVLRRIIPSARICYPWEVLDGVVPLWKVNYTGMTQLALIFRHFEEAKVTNESAIARLSHKIDSLGEQIKALDVGGGCRHNAEPSNLAELILGPLLLRLSEIETKVGDGVTGKSADGNATRKAMDLASPLKDDYMLTANCGCLDAWINWWHGEEKTRADGSTYRTPPWRSLSIKMPGMKRSRGSITSLTNLRYLCRRLNEAAGIEGLKRCPKIEQLQDLYQSERVQAALPSERTPKGRLRRLQDMKWEVAARCLRTEGGRGEKVDPTRKRICAPGSNNSTRRKRTTKAKPVSESHSKIQTAGNRKIVHDLLSDENISSNAFQGEQLVRAINGRSGEGRSVAYLYTSHIARVETPGSMLSSECINGFFHAMFSALFENAPSVERVVDTFLSGLVQAHQINRDSAWDDLEDFHVGYSTDKMVYCRSKVLFVPAFVGPRTAGHWFFLVIDRRSSPNGVVTVFDSCPAYTVNRLNSNQLEALLQSTPLVCPNTQYVYAECCGQAFNDCGVWLALFAAKFALGLNRSNFRYNSVRVQFREGATVNSVGMNGRSFISEVLQTMFLSDHRVLEMVDISFSRGTNRRRR